MSLKHIRVLHTVDLTDNQKQAEACWEDCFAWLEMLAGFNLRERLANIKILEIGCGRAHFLRHGIKHGVDIVGVDRNIFPFNSDLPIHQADINDELPFDDETFDLAYARGVFDRMHGIDENKALRNIQRTMKANALFIIKGMTHPDQKNVEQNGLVPTSPPLANYCLVLRKV